MNSSTHHVAQVNIARMRAPFDDAIMAGFVALLDEINALADRSPGFVWRLQTASGNAVELRPYNDDRILVNLSVWQSLDPLKSFVYRGAHAEVMRKRSAWFEKFDGMYMALWWVKAGHLPDVAEAKQRLEHLREHGPSVYAFSFQQTFPPGDSAQEHVPPAVRTETAMNI